MSAPSRSKFYIDPFMPGVRSKVGGAAHSQFLSHSNQSSLGANNMLASAEPPIVEASSKLLYPDLTNRASNDLSQVKKPIKSVDADEDCTVTEMDDSVSEWSQADGGMNDSSHLASENNPIMPYLNGLGFLIYMRLCICFASQYMLELMDTVLTSYGHIAFVHECAIYCMTIYTSMSMTLVRNTIDAIMSAVDAAAHRVAEWESTHSRSTHGQGACLFEKHWNCSYQVESQAHTLQASESTSVTGTQQVEPSTAVSTVAIRIATYAFCQHMDSTHLPGISITGMSGHPFQKQLCDS
ncbi:hypothetical protein BSLG_005929 [Batrachochytrium salamandrivorans]|nr:hypothetical protein BSLG_005929 [Batrachochytrium salamandrivorans]